MALMLKRTYQALKEAGASEEAATAAAEELANYEARFNAIDANLEVLKAELGLVKWIVSGIGFGVLLLVIRSFWPN